MKVAGWTIVACIFLAGCHERTWRSPHAATIAEGRAAIQEAMTETKATSVSVALLDRGHLVWSEAFGTADRAQGRPASRETLYSVASVSKMLATTAVMLLVDQGRVALDEPLVTYLPDFAMPLDRRHRDITVRMLLCHTSGLPGNDDRGALTLAPFPGYARQLMADLAGQRLKHDPGLLASYNNDGFTMVENLVKAVSGQDYPAFVREHILAPLGMDASRYQVEALPDQAYARSYAGDSLLPLYSYNIYATGGLFSTPDEMARLADMLLQGGTVKGRRLLSPRSVAAMGEAQRLGTFDPAPCAAFSFGLGWDTVAHPGLAAVGVRGWQKGGDLEDYFGANMLLAPDEGLAVVVLGASNGFSSTAAGKICERILLRALVERGRIPAMPQALVGTSRAQRPLPAGEREAYAGHYASDSAFFRVSFGADDTLTLDKYGTAWQTLYSSLRYRDDGWYASDTAPLGGIRLMTRGGRAYMAIRDKYGYGHYQIQSLYGQRLEARGALSSAWTARTAETWLPVDGDPADLLTSAQDPSLRFRAPAGLEGHLLAGTPLRDQDPPSETRLDGMFLTLPDGVRDLKDATPVARPGETWLRLGARLHRPLSSLDLLSVGTRTVEIGTEGFAEWRKLPATGRVTVSGATCWSLHGADLAQLARGNGSGSSALGGSGVRYLVVMGPPGRRVTVELEAP